MQIHNVIILLIILIVEIFFIDPNLEDNNVTISNGAYLMEQYTRHAILDYQTCDMFIEYNLSLECHFHYII